MVKMVWLEVPHSEFNALCHLSSVLLSSVLCSLSSDLCHPSSDLCHGLNIDATSSV